MLRVEQVSSYYGPIQALRDVSIDVDAGEAIAVLGPNGAGKSTLLRSISGLLKPRRGRILYQGRDIAGAPTHEIVRLGIIQVPEGRHIFTQMSVLENLHMGAFTRNGQGVDDDLAFVYTLFPDLRDKRHQLGGELSGGQQQMLAIARALMGRPSLLLLDEPSLGLSPILVEQLGNAISDIRQRLGMSIILVEQNVGMAVELASRVYVMQTGRVVLSGAATEISVEQMRRAYLGPIAPAPSAP